MTKFYLIFGSSEYANEFNPSMVKGLKVLEKSNSYTLLVEVRASVMLKVMNRIPATVLIAK